MRSLAETAGANEIRNRDIDPSAQLVSAFPRLRPLIANHLIAHSFEPHERKAVRLKRWYTILGHTALISIFLVMALFDYEFTLERAYGISNVVRVLGACAAALALAAQLVLIFGRIREKWLLQRFATERLRCLKFQAFALVASSAGPERIAADVAAFTKEGIARLDQELMGGRSALDEFSPSSLSLPRQIHGDPAEMDFVQEAYKVYDSLRLGVQIQHFERQARLSEDRARLPSWVSEITFALGGLLALFQICATAWSAMAEARIPLIPASTEPWLAFVSLLLFVSSAILAVYQRGSADAHHSERYRHYSREVRGIRQRGIPGSGDAFAGIVEQMEQIELRELFDFCRDSAHSNYIL